MNHASIVLVVDQDYSSGLIMGKRLASFNCKVDVVGSAQSVMDYLRSVERAPDLVLVNLSSEEDDLINLPARVHALTGWSNLVPFAIYSAIHNKALVTKAVAGGYLDYMVRPIEHDLFKDRVSKLLKRTVTLNDQTFRKPLEEEGVLEFPIMLTQINEFGLTAKSTSPLPANFMMLLKSHTLENLFEGAIRVRVVSSYPVAPSHHDIVLAFVDLESHQVRALRKFAMTHPVVRSA